MTIVSQVRKWAPFRKSAVAEAEALVQETAQEETDAGPPLVLLVSDASGRASFQFNSLPNAASAQQFVEYWFPTQVEGGMIAFWALDEEPAPRDDGEPAAEPVVLICDPEKQGVVYLFSFVDITGAQAFVQSEIESGVEGDSILSYWAAPVRIEMDDAGSVSLTPKFAPNADLDACHSNFLEALETAPEPQPLNGWAKVIGRNVQSFADAEQIKVESPVAASSGNRPQRKPAAKTQPAVSSAEAAVAVVATAREAREVEKTEAPGRTTRHRAERHPSRRTASENPLAEPVIADVNSAQAPSWFTTQDGEPPLDGNDWRNDGFHDLPALDMGRELEKVLEPKRWEAKDGPFEGFQSPPGRF